MTRAYKSLKCAIAILRRGEHKRAARFWPKLGFCLCCGSLSWLTNERPAYSSYDGAFLCEDCANENDKETDLAWQDYYDSRL